MECGLPILFILFYQINSRSYAPTVTAAISLLKSPISILPSRPTQQPPISDINDRFWHLWSFQQAQISSPSLSLIALGCHTHQFPKTDTIWSQLPSKAIWETTGIFQYHSRNNKPTTTSTVVIGTCELQNKLFYSVPPISNRCLIVERSKAPVSPTET